MIKSAAVSSSASSRRDKEFPPSCGWLEKAAGRFWLLLMKIAKSSCDERRMACFVKLFGGEASIACFLLYHFSPQMYSVRLPQTRPGRIEMLQNYDLSIKMLQKVRKNVADVLISSAVLRYNVV
ncbi:MAG: hypothetical protein J6M56_07375 [Clostridia bacterium]|nr:hypothetical protein [Clostridia bacterium]